MARASDSEWTRKITMPKALASVFNVRPADPARLRQLSQIRQVLSHSGLLFGTGTICKHPRSGGLEGIEKRHRPRHTRFSVAKRLGSLPPTGYDRIPHIDASHRDEPARQASSLSPTRTFCCGFCPERQGAGDEHRVALRVDAATIPRQRRA
jgi:hypothetical protein